MDLIWIIVMVVVLIGAVWYIKGKKKGSGVTQKPQEPTSPPPPEAPTM